MSFAHIEEHEAWLRLPHLRQTLLNPMQLRTKTPSVSSELEVLKVLAQDSPGFTGGVEPIDGATADRAVALPAEAFNNVGAFEPEALLAVLTCMAGKSHAEQLARLRVKPGLSTTLNPRRETHPEGSMAAIGEVTRRLGAVQGTNS